VLTQLSIEPVDRRQAVMMSIPRQLPQVMSIR
jgi:hypothetical protein